MNFVIQNSLKKFYANIVLFIENVITDLTNISTVGENWV